jgi:hypothetical protein
MINLLNCSTEGIITGTVDGNYTYVRFATDTAGSGLSSTFNSTVHNYTATITSEVEITNPSASDFTGKWVPIQKSYTYVAFADEQDGTGFTETYSDDLRFFAVLYSTTEIPTRTSSNFTGLWMKVARDGDTFDYINPRIYNTQEYADYTALSLASTMGPHCFYYHGTYRRFYFTVYSNSVIADGTAHGSVLNDNYVAYYDVDTQSVSNLVKVPAYANASASTDRHNIASLIVADDDHVIIAVETLSPSWVHNTSIKIYKSTLPEEIEDPATPGTFYFTEMTEVGLSVDATYGISYPNLCLGPNDGELFMFVRGQVAATYYHNVVIAYKSIDNGDTWTSLEDVEDYGTMIADCDIGGPEDWYFYIRICPCKREHGICLVGVPNEGPDGSTYVGGQDAENRYKRILFMQSYDGITWNNVERFIEGTGGYSKNVVTGGYISPAQNTNFIVVDLTAEQNTSIYPIGMGVGPDKVPVIIGHNWNRYTDNYINKRNVVNSISSFYYNTTTNLWVETDISSIFEDKSSTIGVEKLLIDTYGIFVNYGEGIWDIGMKRMTYAEGLEEPTYAIISDGSEVHGLVYKIAAIATPNHFGTGNVQYDFVSILYSTPASDGTNTLQYVPSEYVIYRTRDWGVSYQLINEPYRIPTSDLCASTINTNYLDSKNLMAMFAVNRIGETSSVTHSDMVYYTSEID